MTVATGSAAVRRHVHTPSRPGPATDRRAGRFADHQRDFIGADSLGYLSIRGVLTALDLPYDRFCFACFDGRYPEPVPYDSASRKFMLEEIDLGVGAPRAPIVLGGRTGQ